MPRIIRRTKTTTRTVTPDGVIEETPVIREEITETDAVGLIGADAVRLPSRQTIISQGAQPQVVRQVVEQPVVRRVVRQPAAEVVEEIIEQPVVRRVVRQPAAEVVEEIIERPAAETVIIERPARG